MKKRIIVLMASLVLLLSMLGCGATAEPETNEAEPTLTEAVTPTPKPTATPMPEPTATPTPEPTATPTPEAIATPTPEPVLSLDELQGEKFNHEFEGIYWLSRYGIYYYDGKEVVQYATHNNTIAGRTGYRVTGNTFIHKGTWQVFDWWIEEDDTFVTAPEGETDSFYFDYCTPITKERAIELCPIISEADLPVVENITYEFEGIYWMAEDGAVFYYNGAFETVYRPTGRVATREYEVLNGGDAFSYPDDEWYTWGLQIEDGNLNMYLAGELDRSYSPITKEQAIEKYPVIGGVMPDTPILAYDFEGVYWLSESGTVAYFDGEDFAYYRPDGSVSKGMYVSNAIYYAFDDHSACYWEVKDGKLYESIYEGATPDIYSPITKERALELYPDFSVGEAE